MNMRALPLKILISLIKEKVGSDDLIVCESQGAFEFAVLYLDGLVDKQLVQEQIITPIIRIDEQEACFDKLVCAEKTQVETFDDLLSELYNGNALAIMKGVAPISCGVTHYETRTVSEPPSSASIKGSREGFIEDVKTNASMVRRRLRTPDLKLKQFTVGKRSNTRVMLFYVEGIAQKKLIESVTAKIERINIDNIADSSYIAKLISSKPFTLFKTIGSCEKPDVFAARILEGRVGVLVDGSPVALTLPYTLVEDFQSAEDYYVTSHRATFTRLLRVCALVIALFIPAYYVCAQLYKIDLLPLGLLLTIASSVQGIPLSPSLEMFATLMVFEVLNEANVRMPKYVGQAISIVGAIVLGETAVKAGILSSPAIIIIALSGICLYTVPDLVETTSILRLMFLVIAGSIGTYGITVFIALLLAYLVCVDSYGTPILAPFAPIIPHDVRDSIVRANMHLLSRRPYVFDTQDKTRMRFNQTDNKTKKRGKK